MKKIVFLGFVMWHIIYAQNDTLYYNKAIKENDSFLAITYFTLSIKYFENDYYEVKNSYFWRGYHKYILEDYYGSIMDITQSLSLTYTKAKCYFFDDCSIMDREQNMISYYVLGDSYRLIGEKKKSCECFSTAWSLGHNVSYESILHFCR